MKKSLTLFASSIFCFVSKADTTQYFTVNQPANNVPITINVGANQTIEIVGFYSPGGASTLSIITATATNNFTVYAYPFNANQPATLSFNQPMIIAGPATISAIPDSGLMLTYAYLPSTADVNKTVIIPSGPNSVAIQLQSSTDLVNWVNATNGVYGGTNIAQFFRIKMQTSP